ncbi:MAG: phosphate propanoyltransferase [Streptococcaceae bacterium]|nr:phosphate propanoyltransferase [Streptococcaceae bacterium]
MENIEQIVLEILSRVQEKVHLESEAAGIEVEMSARHIHLSQEHLEALFGKGYELTPRKNLSQPGQYASEERVTVVGPKGMIQNVRILGPIREESQVEMSLSDLRILGLTAEIRESGHLSGTAAVTLINGNHVALLEQGLIVAKRHVHMSVEDAAKYGLENGQIVKVKVNGKRPLIFDDVVIRVSDKFATCMHLDTDEANACGYFIGMHGEFIS